LAIGDWLLAIGDWEERRCASMRAMSPLPVPMSKTL
jgi:hypothetical protein